MHFDEYGNLIFVDTDDLPDYGDLDEDEDEDEDEGFDDDGSDED